MRQLFYERCPDLRFAITLFTPLRLRCPVFLRSHPSSGRRSPVAGRSPPVSCPLPPISDLCPLSSAAPPLLLPIPVWVRNPIGHWGCETSAAFTQGSSSLATLGWRADSLWDS